PIPLEQGGSATTGIENAAGTVALQYSLNQPVLRTGNGVLFHPPAAPPPPPPPPPGASIARTVTASPAGGPISNARVTLAPGGAATTAALDGTYRFDGLAAGTYTVTATAPGGQTASGSVTVGSGTSTVNLTPTLSDSFGNTCSPGPRTWIPA